MNDTRPWTRSRQSWFCLQSRRPEIQAAMRTMCVVVSHERRERSFEMVRDECE
jgi:hypothetical protein